MTYDCVHIHFLRVHYKFWCTCTRQPPTTKPAVHQQSVAAAVLTPIQNTQLVRCTKGKHPATQPLGSDRSCCMGAVSAAWRGLQLSAAGCSTCHCCLQVHRDALPWTHHCRGCARMSRLCGVLQLPCVPAHPLGAETADVHHATAEGETTHVWTAYQNFRAKHASPALHLGKSRPTSFLRRRFLPLKDPKSKLLMLTRRATVKVPIDKRSGLLLLIYLWAMNHQSVWRS